jgi:hydrogenase-4 component F
MNALLLTVFVPVGAAVVLALLRSLFWAGWVNVAASALSFGGSVWLAWSISVQGGIAGYGFHVDAFNVYLVVLTAFVGLTTSIFSRPYMRHVVAMRMTDERGMRVYHAMYQVFMFTMLLALSTNNLGVLWVAWRARRWRPCCWCRCTARRRRWRRPGSTSSSAASASRWRCSVRC